MRRPPLAALLLVACTADDAGLEERPWLVRDGVTLRWQALPLDVYVADSRLDAYAFDGVDFWNGVAGRTLFSRPLPAERDIVEAFSVEATRAGLARVVLLVVGGDDPGHGETDLRFDKRDGRLINAVVTVTMAPVRTAVVRHEMGHALGLDHSPDGLMAPRIPETGPLPLAAYQAEAVRGLR